MFCTDHEPTQDSASGEGFESTQSCAFDVGQDPTPSSALIEAASAPKPTPGIGEERARSPRVRRR